MGLQDFVILKQNLEGISTTTSRNKPPIALGRFEARTRTNPLFLPLPPSQLFPCFVTDLQYTDQPKSITIWTQKINPLARKTIEKDSLCIFFNLFLTDSLQQVPFDLVFLIRLRYVKKEQTLVEIIKKQHDTLEESSSEFIQSILKGRTNHRVLLMLDGYDEYKPGTNMDIDRAIESTIGNCFLILTSRPGSYLNERTRDKMDGEIIIEGLIEENILEFTYKYLGSDEESIEMLKQAEEAGIHGLLHVPIILVMTVVVFREKLSLPNSKTGLYETIFRLAMDRTTLKTFGCKSADIFTLEDLLYTLGEFSWKALQDDVQQLLLKNVRQ